MLRWMKSNLMPLFSALAHSLSVLALESERVIICSVYFSLKMKYFFTIIVMEKNRPRTPVLLILFSDNLKVP